ncbi:hypothetical protein CH302_19225 [Rhodococcus sp. 15-2388-1-1a]|uniref:hypothetical protein n=1 Tax=Nocardiaceae TaxID=85025 RepID=UPI00068C6FE0|nr:MULTISPECIES: hypothetical protein [Rhodococcus]OZE95074.1 hypothetical protein CH302_19225 [Rhodococcus sp. 15-2388-1-1a]
MRTVILCRGIGEPYEQNLLRAVTKDLDRKRFNVIELVWSAEFGGVPRWDGDAFGVSVANAQAGLFELIRRFPGAIILGYSGGAQVAGNVAAEIGRGMHLGLSISAVGLISDPSRHTAQIIGQNRGGQGIMGGRYIAGNFQVWQLSAWGDPISELPFGNGLGVLAQGIEFWSIKDPARWMDDLKRKALTGRLRFWDRTIDWVGAHQWSLGYTRDGRHTCYYRENMADSNITYAQKLTQLIVGLK